MMVEKHFGMLKNVYLCNLINKGSITFCMGNLGKGRRPTINSIGIGQHPMGCYTQMGNLGKGRRPLINSVGQRPMKSGRVYQYKAESLEAVLFSGFRPFRALHSHMFLFHRALPDAIALKSFGLRTQNVIEAQ